MMLTKKAFNEYFQELLKWDYPVMDVYDCFLWQSFIATVLVYPIRPRCQTIRSRRRNRHRYKPHRKLGMSAQKVAKMLQDNPLGQDPVVDRWRSDLEKIVAESKMTRSRR